MDRMDSALQDLRRRVIDANAAKTPLRLRGAGTKDFYGERCDGALLDMRGYCGVVDYEPSELVITARCGTSLSDIESLLARNRQFLAFEPPAFAPDPTIGGIIACGLSGPRRSQAGAARDFVLGAVLLCADGELLHFGGKVIKNVAGFDVSRLLCGSLGILGAITEVSLKVLPLPRTEQTLQFEMPAAQALESFNRWAGLPLPISASGWWNGQARVRLSGAPSALRAARTRLGGELLDAALADPWWRSLRDQTHTFFRDTDTLWRLSLPSSAPPVAGAGTQLIEWGGALRWCASDLPAAQLRALATAAGGTALHWRGGAPGQRFHPLAPSVLAIHRRLKARFDPHRIFNPGRLIADL
ncbi:MAG TPA: glycolate oxidase subunit GlcE [Steroidobacteraceae bacterium]|jgi:glycolate oxidase FAD binding subunit|nr:glycolate oxidase subunit GlcE [Steroidobacteraceae bacterium]